MEGLGSPKAMPNLDIKSKKPNHTTTLLAPWRLIIYIYLHQF